MDFFPSLNEFSLLPILRNLGSLVIIVAWLALIGVRVCDLCVVGFGTFIAINLVGCPPFLTLVQILRQRHQFSAAMIDILHLRSFSFANYQPYRG